MRFLIVLLFSVFLALPVSAQDSVPPQTQEKDIFNYLDQSIIWYRHIGSAEASDISSREALLRNSLQQNALKTLRYSFEFARVRAAALQAEIDAEKKIAEEAQKEAAKSNTVVEAKPQADQPFNPAQAKANIVAKIADVQSQINATEAEIAGSGRAARVTLQAKREKLTAELTLAKTQESLIDTILSTTDADQQETVTGQIDNLAKAIPELAVKKKAVAAAPISQAPAQTPVETPSSADTALQILATGKPADPTPPEEDKAPEAKGVIGLIGEMIARSHQKEDLSDLADETAAMQKSNEGLINEYRVGLIEIVRRSKDLSEKTDEAPADALTRQSAELTKLNDDFKQISALIVPLGKQRMSLRNAQETIENWQKIFSDEMSQIARRLMMRLVSLIVMIAVPFLLSELARRVLSQYIQEARRRRQLNIIRRVIVGVIVSLIVLLNLISEFGSMATFIGFVTAGLAVALQNVILSIVAYFFFFGRFGIKIGSRVTVGTVTGDVIETGFVRLYMMELTEEKGQYRPTGRIVAFPNSILFQPTAFYKQVPGVTYRWHEITYTLEADTERDMAETKLREIIDSVYKDNKGMIDMQKAALEQSTRLRVKEPRPDGKIERTPEGLNVTVRYPVDTDQPENTDKSVIRIAGEVFEKLPSVKRINDDPPAIKRSGK